MPRVYRVMKKSDGDEFPRIGPTDLGVRLADVDVDSAGNVIVNGKGMSVAHDWRRIFVGRLPKRLRSIVPGARGANSDHCFRMGFGPFLQGSIANGLTLEPDSAKHGNVAPELSVPMATYEADLAATRADWEVDET